MTMYNGEVDPYHSEGSYYECRECGARGDSGGVCGNCDSDALVNIAVPRE
jgi:primosomal protein N'